MKNFGDYFYILIMVGVFIFSIIKNTRKKEEQTPSSNPNRRIPDVLEEVFPDIRNWMDDEEETQVVPEPVPVIQTLETIPPTTHFTYDSPENAQPTRGITRQTVISAPMELESDQESMTLWDEPIDLRKAVLYAEILKRPVW